MVLIVRLASASGSGRRGLATAELAAVLGLPLPRASAGSPRDPPATWACSASSSSRQRRSRSSRERRSPSSAGSSSPRASPNRSSSAASTSAGLAEHPVDLLADRLRSVRVAPRDAFAAITVPSSATSPTDTNPARAHSASTLVNVRGQRVLMTRAEARDRGVIRRLVGADHPTSRRPHGSAARSPATTAPRPRSCKAAARPSSPDRAPPDRGRLAIGGVERVRSISRRRRARTTRGDPRQPLAQARRQQQLLLAITRQEVLRHAENSQRPPGQQSPPTAGFVRQPQARGILHMRRRGLEPPRGKSPTRPSTLRVYQFRHRRDGAVSVAQGHRASPSRCFRRTVSLLCEHMFVLPVRPTPRKEG